MKIVHTIRMTSLGTIMCAILVTGAILVGATQTSLAAKKAKSFPDGQTVTIIAGYAPGSASDIEARELAKALSAVFKSPVIVEDEPGASTAIAVSDLLLKPANGLTLDFETSPDFAGLFLGSTQVTFKRSQITPLAAVGGEPSVIYVKAGTYGSMRKLLAAAKAHPGTVTMGGTGTGGFTEDLTVALQRKTGVTFKYVPYAGGSDEVDAVLSGEVVAGVTATSNVVNEVAAGQLKALALTSADRSTFVDGVPTLTALGYKVPPIVGGIQRGLFVKAGTPKEVVASLDKDVATALKTAGWKEYAAEEAQQVLYQSSSVFSGYIGTLIKELKTYTVAP